MVSHAAPRAGLEHSQRRRHGARNGGAHLVESARPAHALRVLDSHPHAAGSHAARDRFAAPLCARLLRTPRMPTENYTFMFYGFTVAWLVIVIYVISIALREKKLREELERVKRMGGAGARGVNKA